MCNGYVLTQRLTIRIVVCRGKPCRAGTKAGQGDSKGTLKLGRTGAHPKGT